MAYTVGEVAKLARISVRTLHHYDEIGLLVPSKRTEAGYRLYTLADMQRLQQVLFYKGLGFSLEEAGCIMADPTFDRREALRTQRETLLRQVSQLQSMLQLIDTTLQSLEQEQTMTAQQLFDFGDFNPAEYEEEARERWGDTDAYKESARRTKGYSAADWQRFRAEQQAINDRVAALLDAGVAATDPRAMDAVEQHRLQIDQWFYPCSHTMHTGLAEMYLADPRFTAFYEKIRPGLAQYVHDAILANAARAA